MNHQDLHGFTVNLQEGACTLFLLSLYNQHSNRMPMEMDGRNWMERDRCPVPNWLAAVQNRISERTGFWPRRACRSTGNSFDVREVEWGPALKKNPRWETLRISRLCFGECLGLTIQSKWTHRLMKGWGFQGHRGLGFAILMEILYKAHERGKPINRPHIHQKWEV